ncbi:Uncharacterised protein [Vibrio cholerae]|nr:Uncharacterised protein [Vibrio cholerae]
MRIAPASYAAKFHYRLTVESQSLTPHHSAWFLLGN